jgi:hypothetical protein
MASDMEGMELLYQQALEAQQNYSVGTNEP